LNVIVPLFSTSMNENIYSPKIIFIMKERWKKVKQIY